MSPGKLAAQVAHATMISCSEQDESKLDLWVSSPHKTIIVLQARNENHLRSIKDYLTTRKYRAHMIVDEGVNEIDPHTVTAIATDILDKDDENVIKTFSTFELYKETITVNMEIKL